MDDTAPAPGAEHLPEKRLIARARGGCLKSFGALVRRHERVVYTFLLRRCGCGADAEDLAQETFVRAWQRLDRYDPGRPLITWLLTLAARTHAAARRVQRRRSAIDERQARGGGPQPPSLPDEVLAQHDETRRLHQALESRVKPDERSAIWLRYALGLSIADIARVLGRSTIATRVMLFRTRERLLKALRPAPTAIRGAARSPASSTARTGDHSDAKLMEGAS